MIGLSHAEYVSNHSSEGVSNHNHSSFKLSKTKETALSIVSSCVFYLDSSTRKDDPCIFEVEATIL